MAPALTLLSVEPKDELHFVKTAKEQQPTRILKLKNTSTTSVAFKVKTTAPKSYLVRPSSGTVKPGEDQEVQIILQPQAGGDTSTSNHRFLVQAVPSNGETFSREQWAEMPKEKVQEHRLNVVCEERNVDEPAAQAQPAGAGAAQFTTASPNEGPGDLKVKYDELVQYTLMLEKEKKKMEEERDNLKRSSGSTAVEGYSKMQLMIVALIVFLLSYGAKFIS